MYYIDGSGTAAFYCLCSYCFYSECMEVFYSECVEDFYSECMEVFYSECIEVLVGVIDFIRKTWKTVAKHLVKLCSHFTCHIKSYNTIQSLQK